MLWLVVNWRLVAAASALCTAFLAGWGINGWRWNAEYQGLINEHVKALAKAEQDSRTKEREFQDAADKERNTKDEKIRRLNTDLERAVAELRKRTSRPVVAEASGNCQAATGRELYREDAEFLIREAARADAMMAEWQACYSTYESIRSKVK